MKCTVCEGEVEFPFRLDMSPLWKACRDLSPVYICPLCFDTCKPLFAGDAHLLGETEEKLRAFARTQVGFLLSEIHRRRGLKLPEGRGGTEGEWASAGFIQRRGPNHD